MMSGNLSSNLENRPEVASAQQAAKRREAFR